MQSPVVPNANFERRKNEFSKHEFSRETEQLLYSCCKERLRQKPAHARQNLKAHEKDELEAYHFLGM